SRPLLRTDFRGLAADAPRRSFLHGVGRARLRQACPVELRLSRVYSGYRCDCRARHNRASAREAQRWPAGNQPGGGSGDCGARLSSETGEAENLGPPGAGPEPMKSDRGFRAVVLICGCLLFLSSLARSGSPAEIPQSQAHSPLGDHYLMLINTAIASLMTPEKFVQFEKS